MLLNVGKRQFNVDDEKVNKYNKRAISKLSDSNVRYIIENQYGFSKHADEIIETLSDKEIEDAINHYLYSHFQKYYPEKEISDTFVYRGVEINIPEKLQKEYRNRFGAYLCDTQIDILLFSIVPKGSRPVDFTTILSKKEIENYVVEELKKKSL